MNGAVYGEDWGRDLPHNHTNARGGGGHSFVARVIRRLVSEQQQSIFRAASFARQTIWIFFVFIDLKQSGSRQLWLIAEDWFSKNNPSASDRSRSRLNFYAANMKDIWCRWDKQRTMTVCVWGGLHSQCDPSNCSTHTQANAKYYFSPLWGVIITNNLKLNYSKTNSKGVILEIVDNLKVFWCVETSNISFLC